MKNPTLMLSVFGLLASLALAEKKPLQVYILAGQSNMQGHAQVRTFEHIGMDPKTAPMLAEMQNSAGKAKVLDDVWISSIGCANKEQTGKLTAGFGASERGPKIGPEFTFGIYIRKFTDAPVLLIKTSWGGKSLNTDFRPPSSGPYEFNEKQIQQFAKQGKDADAMKAAKAEATGVYYKLMMDHVKRVIADIKRVVPDYDADRGHELAGFVWFQGWNDMVDQGTYPDRDKPGGYDAYSRVMADFIRDVRKDLQAPKLPFVIGVIGVGGSDKGTQKTTHQNMRDAMAAPAKLPEFDGNVAAVLTEKYWDAELSQLSEKQDALRQEAKKQARRENLKPADERSLFEKLCAEKLTERERKILEVGISNREYHYLGSAKILGGIGKGFAEAMAELKGLKQTH